MPKKVSPDVSDLLEPILIILRDDPQKYFTIKQIAKKVGTSDVLAMEAIGGLSIWGYRFETDSRSHFRFVSAPDSIFPFEIQYGLKTKILGQEIESHFSVSSTNDYALKMAEKGAPEGTLVITEKQRSGRGRMGRTWHSPPKTGLWFSMILRPDISPASAPGLSILTALTLSEVLRSKYRLHSQIKWPNDCLIDGRKISGILTELSADPDKIHYVIVGVGININVASKDFPGYLKPIATSLRAEKGEEINRIDFLRAFLEKFEKNYLIFKTKGLKPFLPKVKKHSLMLGKKIKLKLGKKIIQAKVYDIDSDGALLTKHRKETLRVTAGEVTILDTGGH
jgi:BirA family transcriptional regulator, biotin operon repressor / biotin---[acetyl-CoA-carboxylase] ligase